jgi:hypothetical protein
VLHRGQEQSNRQSAPNVPNFSDAKKSLLLTCSQP